MKVLTEKDISTMATNFSGRTGANSRMYFGARWIKYLKAFTHWIQDFYRTSGLPTIVGLSAIVFKSQLDRAAARSDIRKNMADQTKTSADAASPVPLENKKKWKHWEENFASYARSHIRASGVLVSYVIREND